MKVTLATNGGLGAGLQLGRRPLVVDDTRVSNADARRLAVLVDAARAEAPSAEASRPAPDAMSYTITVEDDSQPMVLQRSDNTMSLAFAELLDWLSRHGPTDQPGRTS
jgi:hypothetical protein